MEVEFQRMNIMEQKNKKILKLTISKYAEFHYKCMFRFFPFSYGYSSCRLIFQLGIKCMTLLKSAWTGLSEKVLPFYSSWLFLKTMGGLIKSMHFFWATLYVQFFLNMPLVPLNMQTMNPPHFIPWSKNWSHFFPFHLWAMEYTPKKYLLI